MLESLKKLFSGVPDGSPQDASLSAEHKVMVATCALLVEIARIDETFTKQELNLVMSILHDKYNLSPEHADALMTEAEAELDDSVDLWQFARLINENYSNEEKIDIVETLWRIVYVDGRMDKYEHYLMNKIQHLLRLSHQQLIETKLKVLHNH